MSWSFNTCLSYIKGGLCSITIVLYFQTRQPALFMQFNSLNYLDLMRYLEYISQCITFESKFCNKTYYWKKPLTVDAQLPKSKIVGLIMEQEFELIWHFVFKWQTYLTSCFWKGKLDTFTYQSGHFINIFKWWPYFCQVTPSPF